MPSCLRKMFAPLELETKPLNLDAGKWLKDAFQDIGRHFLYGANIGTELNVKLY